MTLKLGINGFGRIGRAVLSRIVESRSSDVQVIKINAVGDLKANAHLLKYDSVHGHFPGEVTLGDGVMDVGQGPIKMFSTFDPGEIDWSGVDIVLECTGKFNSYDACKVHLKQGAKRVLISAPAKGADKTIVYGVNHEIITGDDLIISNASCTTNCLAPLAKVLNDRIGIENGIMTTVHAYTRGQPALDGLAKDLYRARAAAMSMIPTSTGAAKAVGLVLPELDGRLEGSAIRVPTPNVSAVHLTFYASQDVTVEMVNSTIKQAAEGPMKDILDYDPEEKVSIDFNHDPHSSNFAPAQTQVSGKRLVRILSWYDNEWGFACRMIDTARVIGTFL